MLNKLSKEKLEEELNRLNSIDPGSFSHEDMKAYNKVLYRMTQIRQSVAQSPRKVYRGPKELVTWTGARGTTLVQHIWCVQAKHIWCFLLLIISCANMSFLVHNIYGVSHMLNIWCFSLQFQFPVTFYPFCHKFVYNSTIYAVSFLKFMIIYISPHGHSHFRGIGEFVNTNIPK